MSDDEVPCDPAIRLAISLRIGRDIASPSRHYAAGVTGAREVHSSDDVRFLMAECGLVSSDYGRVLALPSMAVGMQGTTHVKQAVLAQKADFVFREVHGYLR